MSDPGSWPPCRDRAVWWVTQGVHVVPVTAVLKKDAQGKLSPRPFDKWEWEDRTQPRPKGRLTTRGEVDAFWAEHPEAQLAIVLDEGLGVIDVDLKNLPDGKAPDNAPVPSPFPGGLAERSKSGGSHLFFRHKVGMPDGAPRRWTGFAGYVDVLAAGLLFTAPSEFVRPDGTTGGLCEITTAGPVPEFDSVFLALNDSAPWLAEAWRTKNSRRASARNDRQSGRDEVKAPDPAVLEAAIRAVEADPGLKATFDGGVTKPNGEVDRSVTEYRLASGLKHRGLPFEVVWAVVLRCPHTKSPYDKRGIRYFTEQVWNRISVAPPPELAAEPCKDLDEALAHIRRVTKTKDPQGAMIMLVIMAQDHVLEFLDSTVYLGFKGRTGAGKGTGLESAILLAKNGQVLSVTTPADLAAALEEGRAVGIPEADTLFHRDPLVAKILRDGYRRGNDYGFMVPVNGGKVWERQTRSLFGVKVFDFHVSFDPHVLGRSVVLEMEPDDSVDLAMDAEKKARHLAPVRAFLIREAERARREWTKGRVDELWDSREFRAEVKSLDGKVGRDHVVGADLLLVSKLFGWDLAGEIRRAVRARRTLDDLSDEAEVLDVIRELAEPDGKPVPNEYELPTERLLEQLNARRKRIGLRNELTPRGLGSILADLGFKRGEDWKKAKTGPYRDKAILLPARVLREAAQPAQPAQTSLETDPSHDENSPGTQIGPDRPDGPAEKVGITTAFERADPEDLFCGGTTRADRARYRLEHGGP